MSIACPRCHEQVDGAPHGCRDPNCPRLEIEEMEHDQYDAIMAAGRAESAASVAYGTAQEAVIAAARNLNEARKHTSVMFYNALTDLEKAIVALDETERE